MRFCSHGDFMMTPSTAPQDTALAGFVRLEGPNPVGAGQLSP